MGCRDNQQGSGFALLETLEGRTFLSAAVHHAHQHVRAHHHFDVIARSAANAGPSGYSPATVSHAYGFDNILFNGAIKGDGTGQTIAIIDAYDDPNISSDLAAFNTQFGLPAMDGKNGNP